MGLTGHIQTCAPHSGNSHIHAKSFQAILHNRQNHADSSRLPVMKSFFRRIFPVYGFGARFRRLTADRKTGDSFRKNNRIRRIHSRSMILFSFGILIHAGFHGNDHSENTFSLDI